MTTRNLFSILAVSVALAAAGGCAGDDDGPTVCQPGTTQACTCTNGDRGAQTCGDDEWLACVCDGRPVCTAGSTQACVCAGGGTGAQTCSGNDWGACACTATVKHHGDVCRAPSYDCGTNSNLICVVDVIGDAQGICRAPCQLDTSCVENDESWDAGDTSCCDVGNGTRACFAPFTCP